MMQEDTLTQTLYTNYRRAGKDFGFWAFRFLGALKRHGGLAVSKRILAGTAEGGKTKGFQTLLENRRLDLSVEAVVLSPQFRGLFSKKELTTAKQRLRLPAIYWPRPVDRSIVYPDDLPNGRSYWEGAVVKTRVNRYERDPRARKECLNKHGRSCKVCDLQFSDRYGDIGDGFIHVHHTKPFGVLRREYRLDPKKDLVPVCPNCHAMLHRRDPPFSIDELKERVLAKK